MSKPLEHYGTGGFITTWLEGRTIDKVLANGAFVVLTFTDGHEAWIGLQDAAGNQVKGEPFLHRLDARIVLAGASGGAKTANL